MKITDTVISIHLMEANIDRADILKEAARLPFPVDHTTTTREDTT